MCDVCVYQVGEFTLGLCDTYKQYQEWCMFGFLIVTHVSYGGGVHAILVFFKLASADVVTAIMLVSVLGISKWWEKPRINQNLSSTMDKIGKCNGHDCQQLWFAISMVVSIMFEILHLGHPCIA